MRFLWYDILPIVNDRCKSDLVTAAIVTRAAIVSAVKVARAVRVTAL